MAHYAFLDENNIVTEVIVGKDETDTTSGVTDWEQWYGNFRGQVCKRTSYNTYRHYEPVFDYENTVPSIGNDSDALVPKITGYNYIESRHRDGGTPFRGQYANIGDRYDADLDEFVTPAE
jgi:hypothetical protein